MRVDIPTASNTLLLSGLSSVDFSIADVSTTVLPLAADEVLKDITKFVSFESLTKRTDDNLDTRYVLKHRFIADSEFSSFDLTVAVDDVFVFDSPDYDDVSGTTLTVDSIDAFNGFVTLNTAQSSTVYASYRYALVPIQGGITDQQVVRAIIYKAAEMLWDATIGASEVVAVADYRTQLRNKFKKKYEDAIRKINAKGQFRVVKRKAQMREP